MDGAAAEFGRKYYKLLFSLPGTAVLAASSLLVGIAVAVLAGPPAALLMAVVAIVLSLLVRSVLDSTKRILAIYTVLGLFSLGSIITSRALGLSVLASIFAPLVIVGGLFTLVLAGLRPLFVFLSVSILLAIVVSVWSPMPIGMVLAYTGVVAVYTIAVIARIGVEGLSVTRAILLSWLNDDYRQLESIASKHSSRQALPVFIFSYRTEEECTSVIVPRIHFGPFRRAGSASLPYSIQKLLGLGRAIILHGDVGHRLNLVSSTESERVARIIASEVSRECNITNTVCRMVAAQECSKGFRAQPLPSPYVPLVIVDRPGKGIDDVHVGGDHGCVVVDAHNELLVGRLEPAEAQDCVEKSCRAIQTMTDCRIGFYVKTLSRKVADELGLCKNWVQVLVLECSGEGYAVVVFPSNNAEHGARELVESILRRHGLRGTLITIDDHECVGLYPGIAEKILLNTSSLKPLVEEAVAKAMERMRRVVSCSFSIVLVESSVWGSFYDLLNTLAHRSKSVTIAGLLLIPLSILLPILLGSILA